VEILSLAHPVQACLSVYLLQFFMYQVLSFRGHFQLLFPFVGLPEFGPRTQGKQTYQVPLLIVYAQGTFERPPSAHHHYIH
jgi:hypothetical protein